VMSALLPKADIHWACRMSALCRKRTHALRRHWSCFTRPNAHFAFS